VLSAIEVLFTRLNGHPPDIKSIWWAVIWVPIVAAAVLTSGAGGATLARRLVQACLGGGIMGWLYAVGHAGLRPLLMLPTQDPLPIARLIAETAAPGFWQAFVFALLSLIAALAVETRRLRN
jgi:hypothetical protein